MKEKTLADHADEWLKEQGYDVPPRNTKAWRKLYEKWIDFAFKDFKSPQK